MKRALVAAVIAAGITIGPWDPLSLMLSTDERWQWHWSKRPVHLSRLRSAGLVPVLLSSAKLLTQAFSGI